MGKDGSSAITPSGKKRRNADGGGANTSASRKRRSSNFGGAFSSAPPRQTFYQEYCELPFTLSTILVDELDFITQKDFDGTSSLSSSSTPRRSLHDLPAKVTVRQVLQHYQRKRTGGSSSSSGKNNPGNDDDDDNDSERAKKQQQDERVRRFCESLALLFDDALPVCLLYHEERPQYESLQHDEATRLKRPCEIYGSTFLLRLLQRLPMLLRAESNKEMETLGPLIADLVVLLQKNRQACFKDSYRRPRNDELFSWEKESAAFGSSDNQSNDHNNQ